MHHKDDDNFKSRYEDHSRTPTHRFLVRGVGRLVCVLIVISYVVIGMTTMTTESQSVQVESVSALSRSFETPIPIGISRILWRRKIPANNPISQVKVSLGQALYFDKRLSADGKVSCATCHDPASAFTDHSALSTGVSNKTGARNAPTILNAMFSEKLFWDGRVGSLEEQAKQPLTNPFEMGMDGELAVVARVSSISEYRREFQRVFKREGISIDTIAKALAAYERTQLSANSPFDRYIAGDAKAINQAQLRGWELFKGKAKCIDCHSFSTDSPFFTDFEFHNTGIAVPNPKLPQFLVASVAQDNMDGSASNARLSLGQPIQNSVTFLAHTEGYAELGRFLVTKKLSDVGAFKTPTLRDIELTTPYMHNGSEKTLVDVLRLYNRGGNPNLNLDKRMRPLNLSESEINDLIEFMRALTSDDVLRRTQNARPQTRTSKTGYSDELIQSP